MIIRIACVLAGIAVLYALFVLALVAAGRNTDARALAGFVPDCVVLFSRLLRDARLPKRHSGIGTETGARRRSAHQAKATLARVTDT